MTDTKTNLFRTLLAAYERHTARFSKVTELRRKEGRELILEPFMRDDKGAVRRDGVLNLPMRCDFGHRFEGGVQQKNLSVRQPDEDAPGCVALAGMDDTWVSPFAWNAVDVQFRLDKEWPNFKPLRQWFLEWSLPGHEQPKENTRGVVHRLEGPTPAASGWHMCLDLGTAPPESVLELLGALSSIGATQVSLGASIPVDAR